MKKRDRVFAAIRGEEVDHVPCGFSLHFPHDRAFGDASVEAHLRFELGIARPDSLVEVVVGLVEVAFGDVVARVLFEETFAARAQAQCEESQRKEIFRFHGHRHF